ncbi:hypothetical protein WQ54_27810 [Bacillus sp. SA1-12]|uniref:hypothetical protein n=1 Tax=Bacillus sp. SA1-12 TaxID=1455638 RepID=UPI0006271CD5|nr:hypothetical protein [Bacillus sp. SA1-12]KKI89038.1 hypothetical protein WQ54_27810 [Bacillus sp. SA1-12]
MYQKILQSNESFTMKMVNYQDLDPNSKYFGGIIDPAMGVALPSHWNTPRILAAWVASIVNPDSHFYHNEELIERLRKMSEYMLRHQHQDGTISLGSTNYHSPPDTGFVVVGLSQVYLLLNKQSSHMYDEVCANLKVFLERTVPALLTGGCHTPNHRWVLTAALSFLNQLFPNKKLLNRAEEWLAEGLDFTEDGEWTERSNGIYNAVNNMMLYHASQNLNCPELLEPVRRNLELMQYLVHPSGEVVTDYSGRQDFGVTSNLSNYYVIYRLMAAHDNNRLFAYMADFAAESVTEPGSVDSNAMIGHLLYPERMNNEIERQPIPNEYVKTINKQFPRSKYLSKIADVGHNLKILHSAPHTAFGSPIVRYRKKDTSATIMTNTPSFFSLRHGELRLLGTKISTAFSPGIVYFNELIEQNDSYVLRATMEKGYNSPIPKHFLGELQSVDGNGIPWYLLPHQHRDITHLQKHEITVKITPGTDVWRIHIKSDQLDEVFTQVTFIFDQKGTFSGEGVKHVQNEQYFLTEGKAAYSVGNLSLEISSGAHEHWLDTLREDEHSAGCKHLSLNLMTPFDRVIEIKLK